MASEMKAGVVGSFDYKKYQQYLEKLSELRTGQNEGSFSKKTVEGTEESIWANNPFASGKNVNLIASFDAMDKRAIVPTHTNMVDGFDDEKSAKHVWSA